MWSYKNFNRKSLSSFLYPMMRRVNWGFTNIAFSPVAGWVRTRGCTEVTGSRRTIPPRFLLLSACSTAAPYSVQVILRVLSITHQSGRHRVHGVSSEIQAKAFGMPQPDWQRAYHHLRLAHLTSKGRSSLVAASRMSRRSARLLSWCAPRRSHGQ